MPDATDPVVIDYSLALHPRVEGGVAGDAIEALADRGATAVAEIRRRADTEELGFWNLPDGYGLAADCAELAADLRAKFDTMVVLGIGGSSLGGRTLHQALAPSAGLRFLDNVDPEGFERAIAGLDLRRTCFNVVSKSGGTVETAAQLCLVRDLLRRRFGADGVSERLVATTDPDKGLMRQIADEEGLRTLPIPDNVGGRFSVLTAVGLLPAAFAGIDVDGLLRGAAAMRRRLESTEISKNPALMGAIVHVVAMQSGKPIHVMMPYCDRLRPFGEWYAQLWAESLGKAVNRAGETVNVGPTPVCALGATDQHSQVQLFIEGPLDKLITFLAVDDHGAAGEFPAQLPTPYAYLAGRSLAELLDAEQRGTALALARSGRPSVTVRLPRVDAESLGGLFFFYEAQTAFAGELMNIDAFDQPGVELGKKIAFGLMGRDGFNGALDGLERFREPDSTAVYS